MGFFIVTTNTMYSASYELSVALSVLGVPRAMYQRSSLNVGPRTMPGNKIAGPVIYSIHLPIMSNNSSGWHLTCHLNFQCTTRKQPTGRH